MHKKRVVQVVQGIAALAGALCLLSVAGGSDAGTLSDQWLFLGLLIGLFLFAVGAGVVKLRSIAVFLLRLYRMMRQSIGEKADENPPYHTRKHLPRAVNFAISIQSPIPEVPEQSLHHRKGYSNCPKSA